MSECSQGPGPGNSLPVSHLQAQNLFEFLFARRSFAMRSRPRLADHLRAWHERLSLGHLDTKVRRNPRGFRAIYRRDRRTKLRWCPALRRESMPWPARWNFVRRPKIVMGEFEFPTMGHAWLAQKPRGAQIEFIAAQGERLDAEAYARADRRSNRGRAAHAYLLQERISVGRCRASRVSRTPRARWCSWTIIRIAGRGLWM